MRRPRRYDQIVYVSNKPWYGAEEYLEPFPLAAIVSSKPQNLIINNSMKITQFNNILTFEYDDANAKGITDESHFWVRRVPDKERDKDDFTHTVRGISVTPDNQFIQIEVEGAAGNTPII